MKNILFLSLSCLIAVSAHAAPFAGDVQQGQKLFAKYECSSCHKGKVGGDGSAIFTRPDRIVNQADELIPRIKVCSGAVGANLSKQEEQDLGAYLNQRYYHFK